MRIAHVTFQPTEGDARVERARDAMAEAGYSCPIVEPGRDFALPAMTPKHKARVALLYGSSSRLGAAAAEAAFFSFAHHRQALEALLRLAPDAIHAHDWDGVIVAAAAAQRLGVPFAYDAHEFAAEMHSERLGWRLLVAPLIRKLEGLAARRAIFVIAVGDTIGEALEQSLDLANRPITVRNIPDIAPLANLPYRTASSRATILLHYHGTLARGRGIESAVATMDHLPAHFRLRLTGPWRQRAFERHVKGLLAARPADGRIFLVPPLPHAELVSHAAQADIGLCLLAGKTRHDRGALPNKIFEYLHAGLAIVGSGSDEVARLIGMVGCGASVPPDSPEIIARLLKDWSPETIEAMRRAALRGAEAFAWAQEKRRLVAAWDAVFLPQTDDVSPLSSPTEW
jgi:glycosyltransferase involved in cell wall biosynthesis